MKNRMRISLFMLLLIYPSIYVLNSYIISISSKREIIHKPNKYDTKILPTEKSEEWVSNLLQHESSGMLTLWNRSITPKYIWGDFNGDRAIDLLIPASINRTVEFNYRYLL